MLVVTLLGIVSYTAVSNYAAGEDYSRGTVIKKEMSLIQNSFIRFYNDCMPSDTELDEIGAYGLWCLFTAESPVKKNCPWGREYNFYKNKGWRGPYMNPEGEAEIVSPSQGSTGQKTGNGINVPVIYTPYYRKDLSQSRGCYYRVIIPEFNGVKQYGKITLVNPGADGVLDTSDLLGSETASVVPGGDDTVLQLLPGGA